MSEQEGVVDVRLWPRSVSRLAVAMSLLLLLAGCVSSAQPDQDDGSGGGQGNGGGGPIVADWDELLAGLPGASFTGFWDYARAVTDALCAVYAGDAVVTMEVPSDETIGGYEFTSVWRRPDLRTVDPEDYLAAAQVAFAVHPVEGQAPGLAGTVTGDEYMAWSSAEDAMAAREAVMRMWQAMSAGYFPVGTTFWGAFQTLHAVEATSYLHGAGGELLLPGPSGYDTSLWFRTWYGGNDCTAEVTLSNAPEGAFPAQPKDWEALVSEMPQPGFGTELLAYAKAAVAALRRASAGQDVMVAQTGMASPADAEPKWQQETFTWLRFPVSEDDPGYVLETLTVRLTPGTGTGPLATSAKVTELVAWDPQAYSAAQDFQALVPARDLFLKSYLSIGDDFLEAFDGLQLTPGLTQELPGPDGATIRLTVEEMTQEDAALRVRYTLAYAGS